MESKRFTAKKKAELIMQIFQGKITLSGLARKYDLTPATIEVWNNGGFKGMENQLLARFKDIAARYEENIKVMFHSEVLRSNANQICSLFTPKARPKLCLPKLS